MLKILKHTNHRPWPLPRGPWIMAQVWHDLLFAHWTVPVAALRPLVPQQLEIDTFSGQAWLGIVPFRMSGVRLRGTPAVPGLSRFPELNVRTYVIRDGMPGVWFFSLDAANPVAVWAARTMFHLPYFWATMHCENNSDWIRYESQRRNREGSPASLKACYRPTGSVFNTSPGSLEYFLTERYCLYTANKPGHIIRCQIHHPPWPLQLAEATFEENTMASTAGMATPSLRPELLHFSHRQEVLVWPPQKIT